MANRSQPIASEDAQEMWENGLTKEERASFEFWGKHSEIITAIDAGKWNPDVEAQKHYLRMQDALQRAPRVKGTFERGRAMAPQAVAELQPGREFELATLAAHTTDHNVALEYACEGSERRPGRVPVLFQVKTGEAVDITVLTGLNEKEFLVLKRAKFRIVHAVPRVFHFMGTEYKGWVIEVEQIQ